MRGRVSIDGTMAFPLRGTTDHPKGFCAAGFVGCFTCCAFFANPLFPVGT